MAKNNKTAEKDIRSLAVQATLELCESQHWNSISLQDISKKSEIPLHDLHLHFEDRFDILSAYGRQIDRKIIENFKLPKSDVSHRDLLFDLLMDRFDILNENREAVLSILHSIKMDPKQAVIILPHLGRSMSWILETADIPTSGYKGAIKVAGLACLYLKTVRVWMKDDSPDMAKTMAALDKNLGRAEQWSSTFGLH